MDRMPPATGIVRGTTLLLLTAVAGCASLVERAPLVTPALAVTAKERGIDADAATRGRALYVGACARCHGPVAVHSRTPAQWQEILPRMAGKAQLDAAATRDLEAYLAITGSTTP